MPTTDMKVVLVDLNKAQVWRTSVTHEDVVTGFKTTIHFPQKNKRRATSDARAIARYVITQQPDHPFELLLRDRRNVIRDKDTFGRDPRRTKG
jgi:hypothetical protein